MASLFIQLVTGKRQLNPLWKKPSYRLKFLTRSLFLYPITFKWLSTLEKYPFRDLFFIKQHNLPIKLQRPYLANFLNQKQRFYALKDHYDFLSSYPKSLTKAFYNNKSYLLATILGKNESHYTVEIRASDKYSREGELTLFFKNAEQQNLATLTFSILNWQNKKTLWIAGIQGADNAINDPKHAISQATKNCFGAFPKRLLVDAALAIAHFFHLEQIIAVSNQSHIYNNWRYKSRFNQLHADYDSFWLSLNGELKTDHFFYLPLELHKKAIEDIPSKKRSEYKQRYQMLDQLNTEILAQLHVLMA